MLRRRGVHVTAQRLAVRPAVSDRPHSTANDIDSAVRAEFGTISRRTVYDAPWTLTEKRLLRRIQPAAPPARVEVTYWGRCPDCVAATSGPSDRSPAQAARAPTRQQSARRNQRQEGPT
jgi:hypothetical protein